MKDQAKQLKYTYGCFISGVDECKVKASPKNGSCKILFKEVPNVVCQRSGRENCKKDGLESKL